MRSHWKEFKVISIRPICPHYGPFKYFMVLIDASTKWSHVCLLSTKNVAFARLLGVDAPKMRKKGLFREFSLFSFGLLHIESLVMWLFGYMYFEGWGVSVCESLFHIFILGASTNHWFCIRCERVTCSSNSFEVT